MDEPFSGLDVQLREAMQEETLALLRETRATTMIVTHHPEEAMRLGDRIAVMRAGRLVQSGRGRALPPARGAVRRQALLGDQRDRSPGRERPHRNADRTLPVAGAVADGALAACIRERGIGPSRREGPRGRRVTRRVSRAGCEASGFLATPMRYEVAAEGFDAPLRVRTVAGEAVAEGSEVRLHIDPNEALIFPLMAIKH